MKRREWLQTTLVTVALFFGAPRGWSDEPWEPVPVVDGYSGPVRWSIDEGKTWIETQQTLVVERHGEAVDIRWLDDLDMTWSGPDTFVASLLWEVPKGLPYAGFVARLTVDPSFVCYWAANCTAHARGNGIRIET